MNCKHCDKVFEPRHHSQVYCSADCRVEFSRIASRDAMREKRGPRFCADCDVELLRSTHAKYCPPCSKERRLKQGRMHANKPERRKAIAEGAKRRRREGKYKANDQRKWLKIKSDPVRYAAAKESAKKSYAKKKDDPEFKKQRQEKYKNRTEEEKEKARIYDKQYKQQKLLEKEEDVLNALAAGQEIERPKRDCAICGEAFIYYGRQKYCKKCQPIARRRRQEKYNQRKRKNK